MPLEIRERIITIGESINDLPNGKVVKGLKFLPVSLENIVLPAFIPLLRPFRYTRTDARGFTIDPAWDIYLYVRAVGTGNQAQAESEPEVLLDLFAEAFLTRPQLQYNNNVITGIVGNLDFELIQGMDEPMSYPPKSRQGALYWGAVFRLSIHQRKAYQINVSGA